ncbi:MAG: hypothetical protein IJS45_00265 [Clostridia bacterium]|nr:hypothetical protein [Clostridia bacterium]
MGKKISLYIVLFLLLAAVLFASSCAFTVSISSDTTPVDTAADDTMPADTDNADTQTDIDDSLEGCLFIGDSRTVGLEMAGSLAEADFFCAVGQMVADITDVELYFDGSYCDLCEVLSGREYRKIYIMLGINDIATDLDEVAKKFSELIDLVRSYQPGSKIIIEANLHVTTARSYYGDAFNNDKVDLLNRKLKALADGSSIFWLDANPILDDDYGGLRTEYAEEDGIHPNFGCYVMWGEWIALQNVKY